MIEYLKFTAGVCLIILTLIFWGSLAVFITGLLSVLYIKVFPYKHKDQSRELEKSYKKINKRWMMKQRIRKFFGLKYEE